jgi:hypothetical protein
VSPGRDNVPTQSLASPGRLGDEAIETAATLDYADVPTRVVLPEYLVALYLQPEARSLGDRALAAPPGADRRR